MTKPAIICAVILGTISPLLFNSDLQARAYSKRINIITTDYDLLDTTYIDRGRIDGVRVGDKYQVTLRDGKTITQVAVTGVFDRMASVKIVDSWLLKDGQMAKFKNRPMVVAFNKQMRRPAPEMTVGAKRAANTAAPAPAPSGGPGLPAGPDAAPAPAPEGLPAAPDAGGLPPAPGAADSGLPPAPGVADSGLPPAPGAPTMDAGLPAAPDMGGGLPPAPDAGLPPAPGAADAGLPPAPDMGGGLPPAPDAGLPPAPGVGDAGLPPAPDMGGGLPPAPDAGLPPAPGDPGGLGDVPPPPAF